MLAASRGRPRERAWLTTDLELALRVLFRHECLFTPHITACHVNTATGQASVTPCHGRSVCLGVPAS